MIATLKRSVLAMPGSNARALEKGKTLKADVLMFELEAASPKRQSSGSGAGRERRKRRRLWPASTGGAGQCARIGMVKGDIAAIAAAAPDAIVIPKLIPARMCSRPPPI